MKLIPKLLLSLCIFSLSSISSIKAQARSMWACCSPYGSCALQRWPQKSVCQQMCGGMNQCVLKNEETTSFVRSPYGVGIP